MSQAKSDNETATQVGPATSVRSRGERSRLTAGLMMAVAVHAFHSTAVITAMPLIAAELHGLDLYGAVLSVYLLASIVGLVSAATLVDRRGPLFALQIGLAVLAAGLLASAWAPTMAFLVLARSVEGFGGGILSNVVYASVNLAYPERDRTRVLARLSAAWVLPCLVAPPLAAAIAESVGWRWVFLSVLPALPMALALCWRPLSVQAERQQSTAGGLRTRDALGLALGAGLLLAGASQLAALLRASTAQTGALLLAGGMLSSGLVLGSRSLHAVVPAGTLRARRGLPSSVLQKGLLAVAFFGMEGFLPLATSELMGWSTRAAGLLLGAAGVTWTLGSITHAQLADTERGARTGAALVSAGMAATAWAVFRGAEPVWVYFAWGFAAYGMGIGYNVATATAMARTRGGSEGKTSSALGIADALGIGLGTGLGGALLAAAEPDKLAGALRLHFALMATAAAAAALLGGRLREGRKPSAAAGVGAQATHRHTLEVAE